MFRAPELDAGGIFKTSIEDLPEEVLEIIFLKLSPYRDLKSASLVCTSWNKLIQVVLRKLYHEFKNSVSSSKLQWLLLRAEAGSRITERYSHCCCYYDKSLYIFGGCTATNTTLNDLWRFDLATREWIRPLAMGTYPFPKACASMVVYKDSLVLFGGWSHPTPFPLHQAARFFSELHIYKPAMNRWSHVTTLSHQSPPPMAGHSASVIGDSMVVFGGSQVPGVRTNEVWVFDFERSSWRFPKIGFKRPAPRYGQTQVTLDHKHVLILGGCGGEVPNKVFKDCWLLTVGDEEWTWDLIQLTNMESAPPQLWCHSACKVSDMIVTLSKVAKTLQRTVPVGPRAVPSSRLFFPKTTKEITHSACSQSKCEENRAAGPRYQSLLRLHLPTENVNKDVVSLSYQSSGQLNKTEQSCDHIVASIGEDTIARNNDEISASSAENIHDSADDMSRTQQHVAALSSDCFGHLHSANPSQGRLELNGVAESQPESSLQPFEHEPLAGTSNPRPGQPSVRPNAMKNREKQLEALLKYEKRLRKSEAQAAPETDNEPPRLASNLHNRRHQAACNPPSIASSMVVHVLDISRVLEHGIAAWQKVDFENIIGAPDETVFYTLVEGRGELLMFGGIEKDIHALQKGPGIKSMLVKNSLYVLSPMKQLF